MTPTEDRLRELRARIHHSLCLAGCDDPLHLAVDALLDELTRLRADRERLRAAAKELRTRVRHSQFFPSRGNADDEPQAIIEADAVVQWIDELLREALIEPTPGGST